MFCAKCGAQMNDNFRVCPQCGATQQGQEQNLTNNSTYNGPLGNPTPVLVWGILSLSFAVTFYFSFLGLIFGIVGTKKAKAYREFTQNAPAKQADIGQNLSKAGIIVGAILTAIAFVVFMIYVIAIFAAMSY